MARTKIDSYRLTLNVPTELLTRIDDYAKRLNVNRTSAICMLCSMSLDSYKALDSIGTLAAAIRDSRNDTNKV